MSRRAITLVEMLVGIAITLVMMGAVVTIFANVSSSVQQRRATIELSSQLRHVRNVLQRDLQGATCPAIPWQKPESNHGYLEFIEGGYADTNPSMLTDGIADTDGDGVFDELDNLDGTGPVPPNQITSLVPRFSDGTLVQRDNSGTVISTLNGLGDYDDILALTTRNEEEPFVGLVPDPDTVRDVNGSGNPPDVNPFSIWESTPVQSPLAEVVWFAVENPINTAGGFFGEPGLRTIYRRVLLIAPWVAPYRYFDNTGAAIDTYTDSGATIHTQPGVVRILPNSVDRDEADQALAALIAFQEKYDLSVRLEWDPALGAPDPDPNNRGRWKIVANTLADLTNRENRYEHHMLNTSDDATLSPFRAGTFPNGIVSLGGGYGGGNMTFVSDPELAPPAAVALANANLQSFTYRPFNDTSVEQNLDDITTSYTILDSGSGYNSRPFAYIAAGSSFNPPLPCTARAMLNDDGEVVNVIHGPVPHWGRRRGEDVMLTDALAFDLRLYDPGAPLFLETNTEEVVEPASAAWRGAYQLFMSAVNDEIDPTDTLSPSGGSTAAFRFLGQGAYVDAGYGLGLFPPQYTTLFTPVDAWFFTPSWTPNRQFLALAPGYSVYDTWSFHYENNGVNEDGDEYDDASGNTLPMIDEGTNGFDDRDPTITGSPTFVDLPGDIAYGGVDDIDERETRPPYDRPLRGVQVKLRAFERDSEQIREVTVNQHFVPE